MLFVQVVPHDGALQQYTLTIEANGHGVARA